MNCSENCSEFDLQSLVRAVVRETINELQKRGLIEDDATLRYREASRILKEYYTKETDQNVWKALCVVSYDPYYTIIPLYHQRNYTIEKIAEILNVEPSTVSRNKKRLCLNFYNAYQDIIENRP